MRGRVIGLSLVGLGSAGFVASLVCLCATGWLDGPVAGVGLLMWGALFGSLGWNFVYFSINPPKGQGGTGGWIAAGATFWLMALGGLIPVVWMSVRWLRDRGGSGRSGRPNKVLEHALK
jgi:hypothetical protein